MVAIVKILTNNRAMGGIQNEIDKVSSYLLSFVVSIFEHA